MRLDIYTHFFPARFFAKLQTLVEPARMAPWFNNQPLHDLDERLRMIEGFAEYRQVIANSMPPLETLGGPEATPELARMVNDGLAELCASHPEHFAAFAASLPMNNPEAAVAEIDRAVKQLGARGVQIFSNVNGRPLDDPAFFPIFQRMAEHDLPIWLHPVRTAAHSDYSALESSKYAAFFTFGWPYETTLAMTHLVFSGLFEKLPGIKIIAHHMGAMVPFFEGRVGVGFEEFAQVSPELQAARAVLTLSPTDTYRMFYADTALFGSAAGVRCGLSFFGPQQAVFGSDAPFGRGASNIEATIRIVEDLEVSDEERALIFEGNAKRLLRL
ncbi:MAG TPA: amidohydrolase family protein [Prosthecobacter sp.]|nr:amidohydrolase family protein [Prosthecobacter sp.]